MKEAGATIQSIRNKLVISYHYWLVMNAIFLVALKC